MSIVKQIQNLISRPFYRWAAKRRPKGVEIRLNQKRIFIFPSAAGWCFLLLCMLMLVIGINYENNLVHAIAFLLLGMFVLSILHTYANLSGITVASGGAHPCFAGEQAEFELRLSCSGRRARENLQLAWEGEALQTVDLEPEVPLMVRLYHSAPSRGLLRPRPLLLETRYPLGLLRAWSWLEIDTSVLVYPTPQGSALPHGRRYAEGDGSLRAPDGSEDFGGLEQYHPGMPLRHIAWKTYARGQGLHSKSYYASQDERIWLEWDALPGMATEARLSRLCGWILELERKGDHYGLQLPGERYEPDRGEQHRTRLLAQLALFPGGTP